MKTMLSAGALAALLAAAAAPAFAQATLILPPYDGSGPTPRIATEGQAIDALHQKGVVRISRIGHVGDYWESDGMLDGRPVVGYVFDNGAVETKQASPGELQSAALPPLGPAEQSAQLPSGD
ncbi:MAG TPA: hypothetical protein VKV32_11430 [Stellaceae bacterium]|nr:hypothetical protein [Stellaceae bacterium]